MPTEEELGQLVLDDRKAMATDAAALCDILGNPAREQPYGFSNSAPLGNLCAGGGGSYVAKTGAVVPPQVKKELLSGEVQSVEMGDGSLTAKVTVKGDRPTPVVYLVEATPNSKSKQTSSGVELTGEAEWMITTNTGPDNSSLYKSADSMNAIANVKQFLEAVANANYDKACLLMGEGRASDIPKSFAFGPRGNVYRQYCGTPNRSAAFATLDIDAAQILKDFRVSSITANQAEYDLTESEVKRKYGADYDPANPLAQSHQTTMYTGEISLGNVIEKTPAGEFGASSVAVDVFRADLGAQDWLISDWVSDQIDTPGA